MHIRYVTLTFALFLLIGGPLTVLWAIATPTRRARAGAGGALHPAYLLLMFIPFGLVFLADPQLDQGGLLLLGALPFLLVSRWHRRRIADLPEEELSPQLRWFREQGNPTITFNPRVMAQRARDIGQWAFSREARERQKQWERDQGLR